MGTVRQAAVHAVSLEDFTLEIEAICERVHGLGALDAPSFNRQPRPGAWSVGQCLQHCADTHAMYAVEMQRSIDAGKERGLLDSGGRERRFGWLERWFIDSLEPPAKRRFKAPSKIHPAAELDPDTVRNGYLELLHGCLELRRRSEGLDLYRVRVISPLLRLLKFRLGAAFAILTAHDRRHLTQAERVTADVAADD